MDIPRQPLFSILIVLLLSLIIYLRSVFPRASKKAETIVVGVTTVVFFGLCAVCLRP